MMFCFKLYCFMCYLDFIERKGIVHYCIEFIRNHKMASALYFILTFGLLISVHEWGHFQMARSLNIRVKRFCLGMGPKIFNWKSSKTGIDYTLRLLPFGGYVSFLNKGDDDFDSYPEKEKGMAFDLAPLWKRTLVVAAGPFMNFALAFFVLIGVGMIGEYKILPIITGIYQDSIAQKAGFQANDKVIRIDGQDINGAKQFAATLMAGTGNEIDVEIERSGKIKTIKLDLSKETLNRDQSKFVTVRYGFAIPSSISLTINTLTPDYPAERSGLEVGDTLVSINKIKILHFNDFIGAIAASGNKPFSVTINRKGTEITKELSAIDNDGKYIVGLTVAMNEGFKDYRILENRTFVESIEYSGQMTVFYSKLVFVFVKKLITTEINVNMLSGPIGIAKAAEYSASIGIVTYLSFLALVSINLGVMNLLPIPGLDGAHLMFYGVEAITRKPVNEKLQSRLTMVGIVLLIGLMLTAVYMDFVYM